MSYPLSNVFGEAVRILREIEVSHGEYLGEVAGEAVEDTITYLRELAMDYADGTLLTAEDDAVMCREPEDASFGAEAHDWTAEEWDEHQRGQA